MNPITRKEASIFYFKFLNALPHIGAAGLHPDLRIEWQLHPRTVAELQLNNALDSDGSKRIMGVEMAINAYCTPGHLKLALVSNSTR
jgi:hypothetical protein